MYISTMHGNGDICMPCVVCNNNQKQNRPFDPNNLKASVVYIYMYLTQYS